MPDRLPPLTALRAFDAAARHMSFQMAAAELNVTPAALSFQIKSLEEHLGTQLFHRLNRAVELTEAGRALAPGAKDGFEALNAAWRAARRINDNGSVTVTAGPAFTSKWLAPRLFDFARAHPEIELKFSASLRIVDLERDEIDVAIRFGLGPDTGLHSVPLDDEWITPVMTPELAARFPTPESLKDAPLIIDDSVDFLSLSTDWVTWFRANGIDHTPQYGIHFSQPDHAINAAVSGAGITLGRNTLVHHDIRTGSLVAPFRMALGTQARFRILCQEGLEDRPNIRALREWIMHQASAMEDLTQHHTIIDVSEV